MSLERRLLAGIVASLLLAFTLLLWLGGTAIRDNTEEYVATRLQHDSEALLGQLRIDPSQGPQLPEAALSPVYRQPLSGHYFVIASHAGRLASRSLWDENLPVAQIAAGQSESRHLPGPGGQQLLAISTGYLKQGHALTLLVAEDVTMLEDRIRRYQWFLGGAFLALGTLLVAALRLLLRRGFLPLRQARDQLQQVADGSRERLDVPVPDEVRPLVQELNRLLDLLSQRLTRSRNAMGNLAHALKTPLSLINQALGGSVVDEKQRHDALLQAQRIRDLVERELRRARLAGSGGVGLRFDARAEVPALCEVVQRLHAERALSIDCGELPASPLAADREDMLELLGNLLDNACKWADSRVRLQITESDGAVHIQVEDDGPGVEDAQLAGLSARGRRLDESREGHGLGLAIAGDIVELYEGSLRFGHSAQLGGLMVNVTLFRR